MNAFTRSVDALENRIIHAAELVRDSQDAEVRTFAEEIVRQHSVHRQKLRHLPGFGGGGGDGADRSPMPAAQNREDALDALHDALSELVRLCRQQLLSSCPSDVREYISCTLPAIELHARAAVAVLTRGSTAAARSSSSTARTLP